jgi:hypothetical protein
MTLGYLQVISGRASPALTLDADGATVCAEEAQGASPGERGARAQNAREAQLVSIMLAGA